jgi:phosphate transport system permease protein
MISKKVKTGLKKRYRSESTFRIAGLLAILMAMLFLLVLFSAVIYRGSPAFITHKIALEIDLTSYKIQQNDKEINYRKIIKNSLIAKFPQADNLDERMNLYSLLSNIAHLELSNKQKNNPELFGNKTVLWFTSSSSVDMFLKGKILASNKEESRNLTNQQIDWIKSLQAEEAVKSSFNWNFFKNADSSEAEIAGVAASIVGSILTVVVFLLASFPIGVMAAFYLEEFSPKNIITDIVEVSINNLAAIPSIIFGLLGLVVYLNFMHLPRSSSIVGGLTLSMLVLPIIIIATRNSIKSVPASIKEGAIAMGASKVQVMFHHTFPLSLPGIMTGTILAISRAVGETAPLLMIGMVAFIADVPRGFLDPTTVMPVQIYLWSDNPELGFAEKSAAAIMVLLFFLVSCNSFAIYVRKRFEKKW